MPKRVGGVRLINALDLATLLYNAFRAKEHGQIGWVDDKMSYGQMRTYFSQRRLWIDDDILESLLAHCNFVSEAKLWRHVGARRDFSDFVKSLLKADERFNKDYNFIERIKRK